MLGQIWLPTLVGLVVTGCVLGGVLVIRRWRARRRVLVASTEEDLPWEELLELLRVRSRERVAAGLPPDDEIPPETLLKELLASLPNRPRRPREPEPEDLQFLKGGGAEKRVHQRRWGNPTEVYLTSELMPDRLHGLVINRSTGGLAIFTNREFAAGSTVHVRAIEAPQYVPTIEVEVRHCRKIDRNFLLGCMFRSEIPWNVRVWFG